MNGLKMIETAIKDQQFYSLVLTSYSSLSWPGRPSIWVSRTIC